MKAARIHEFGSPEVIRIDDVPQPTPNEGQVLVRVAAAGVGPWDPLLREGKASKKKILEHLAWYGHSGFRIEAGAAKILIDPFLSDNPSWDKGWIGSRAGEDSTQGGER